MGSACRVDWPRQRSAARGEGDSRIDRDPSLGDDRYRLGYGRYQKVPLREEAGASKDSENPNLDGGQGLHWKCIADFLAGAEDGHVGLPLLRRYLLEAELEAGYWADVAGAKVDPFERRGTLNGENESMKNLDVMANAIAGV